MRSVLVMGMSSSWQVMRAWPKASDVCASPGRKVSANDHDVSIGGRCWKQAQRATERGSGKGTSTPLVIGAIFIPARPSTPRTSGRGRRTGRRACRSRRVDHQAFLCKKARRDVVKQLRYSIPHRILSMGSRCWLTQSRSIAQYCTGAGLSLRPMAFGVTFAVARGPASPLLAAIAPCAMMVARHREAVWASLPCRRVAAGRNPAAPGPPYPLRSVGCSPP